MTDILLLRFDAPLVAFGGVLIDNYGFTQRFPGRSMLAGLLGNALGYVHAEFPRLQSLQRRIRYGARCDRAGRPLVDYHTVDLSQSFMQSEWTARGIPEGRDGGPASKGTHIRYRHYLADAVYSVALTLADHDTSPTVDEVEHALREPARPLFIGRKSCLPAAPFLIGRVQAVSLLSALKELPSLLERGSDGEMAAWWPADEDAGEAGARQIYVTDDRDWANQIHAGRRWMHEGTIRGS
jgi:CRISPR system Cascade subunit CasD